MPWLLALLLGLAATGLSAQPSGDPPPRPIRVGVATMQPGEIFWERFGHNAIVIDDPAADGPVSYNFGYFDPTEPGFHRGFALGRMRYMLVALPLEEDLAYYRDVGRGVTLQWLDMDPAQARALAAALAVNALPGNARYDYDYFLDNCSTRVRDALDRAMDGLLRDQLGVEGDGMSFRSEAVRLARPAPLMALGFDLGLGPASDRPIAAWEAGFVPMRLADGLRGLRHRDGRPVVTGEMTLVPHRLQPEPAPRDRPWWPHAIAGLGVAGLVVFAARRRPAPVALAAMGFWSFAGVLGLLLVFLWGFTAHWSAWANQNLLLLNPLCLGLLAGGWRVARAREPGRVFRVLSLVVAGCALVAVAMHVLPVARQDNLRWIALLLPVHVALAFALGRTPAAR
ncbi:DUF4105 domain-containing protein [Luteimonas pelagia]